MTRKQKKVLVRIIVSSLLLVALILVDRFVGIPFGWLRLVLYLVPYFVIGYDILKKAIKGILHRQVFDENFLMATATVGALAIAIYENGSYVEAIAVMLFYQIGELFQSYAVGKSRRNIADLMDIRPDYANLCVGDEVVMVDPSQVGIGSIIVVSAGEKVPIDGVIVDGNTSFDTSALTGESAPREALVGDEVISGCINLSGTVRIRTTRDFGESTVSRILDLVENSSSKKSKSEQFISRFARVYTPAVCISALALAVIPPVVLMLMGRDTMWSSWIYRALTFLVISCPCALVISIPLSFFAGIGGASREGILVKGSNYLEIMSKIKYLVFDKTGTMTKGVFEVEYIDAVGIGDSELVEYAACAECYSSHPISKSLQNACGTEIDRSRVTDVNEISGHGLTAVVDGRNVAVGNTRLMDMIGVEYTPCDEVGTVVHIAIDGAYRGSIVISDVLKENAVSAVALAKKSGVKKTVMLTGDSAKVADSVAAQLGVDEVYSELLPADKVAKVEELLDSKDDKEKLAFVGDGINDAPVLSRADIGIAMGALGSDAAIEAADVVLMDDDPMKITKAIRISSRCLRIVYENIYFAFGVKGLCLVLGAIGVANMWLAIFADVGVMVIAVLNAVRALNVKKL